MTATELAHPCACCGQRVTTRAWAAMPRRGYQDLGDPHVVLELRACQCGTTRSREVPRGMLSGTRPRVSHPEPMGLHPRHRPAVYDAIRLLHDGIHSDRDWLRAIELESLLRSALACKFESGSDGETALGTLRLAWDRARGSSWELTVAALYRRATRQTIRRTLPGDAPS